MLRSLKSLYGYTVATSDGNAGNVVDFYFDDLRWKIRYLVADTGTWLPGRRVLVSPIVFKRPEWKHRRFPVRMTKDQLRHAPEMGTRKPLSPIEEIQEREFNFPPYWMASHPLVPAYGLGGVHLTPTEPSPRETRVATIERPQAHLLSAWEVTGYRMHATDGDAGVAEDLIVNDTDWTIAYLVGIVGRWPGGRKVLIASQSVREVRWSDSEVLLDLDKQSLAHEPSYDPSEPVNEEYERKLYDYYGRPR